MMRRSLGLGVALAASSFILAAPAWAQGNSEPTGPATQPAPTGAAPAQSGQAGASTGGQLTWNPQGDTGAKPAEPKKAKPRPKKLNWRNTSFVWDQTATGQTVGLGKDFQSRDPNYTMTFSLRPRYYIYDDSAADVSTLGTAAAANAATKTTISVRGDIGLSREFTNSDATTKKGEWTATDAQLYLALVRQLYSKGDVSTIGVVDVPKLTFPSSKFSYDAGRYMELGTTVAAIQQLPLLGSKSDFLQILSLEAAASYSHWFTRATQATQPNLSYVRMNPQGIALPGDQLGGAAFAEHQADFTIADELMITDRISWSNQFSWRPYWKYTFNNQANCVQITGECVTPSTVDNPTHYSVVTLFDTELDVRVLDQLSIAAGYANVTPQIGPDGKRRNIFYSPDAVVYLTATAYLDQIYKTFTKPSASKQTALLRGGPGVE